MRKSEAAVLAIVGGISVFSIKIAAYIISNSIALLSDAAESVTNVAAAALLLFSVRLSGKPPDASHPYGHQKIEEITRLLEGVMITAIAAALLQAASQRLLNPTYPSYIEIAIPVSIVASALNAAIALILLKKSRSEWSPALEGGAKHLFSDVFSSAGVWVGLLLVKATGYAVIDPILAIIVSALVARAGILLVVKSSRYLMDPACALTEARIKEILSRHKQSFVSYHELKTRRSGDKVFSELHLIIHGSVSVKDAHDLADRIESEVRREMPYVNLTIHIEPPEDLDPRSDREAQDDQDDPGGRLL